ncbi:hypothetical protein [Roseibium sp.]|uniref:hypothetical protein n=1 Tax=Roseibium sp. TaxID=1936156 RepID=UPI003A97A2B1
MNRAAYLAVLPGAGTGEGHGVDLEKAGALAHCWLDGEMALVITDKSRSKIYHAIKRQLGSNGALLIAPLSGAPKFKGMAAGSTKWARHYL